MPNQNPQAHNSCRFILHIMTYGESHVKIKSKYKASTSDAYLLKKGYVYLQLLLQVKSIFQLKINFFFESGFKSS